MARGRPNRIPDGIKRGLLTDAENAQIADLGERGLGPGQIAIKLNRHPVTINYAMHRLGVRKLSRRTFCYVRNGVTVKSFSPEEDAYLNELRVQGLPSTKIAPLLTERFGHRRTAHSVLVRLVLLSNVEDAA